MGSHDLVGVTASGTALAVDARPATAPTAAPTATAVLAMSPKPPLTPPHHLVPTLQQQGWAVVDAAGLAAVVHSDAHRAGLAPSWESLPEDTWLKDGGHYRRRRHSCFVVDVAAADAANANANANANATVAATVAAVPHRAHWQPVAYNALHGGLERWFEPIDGVVVDAPAWSALLGGLARVCAALKPTPAADGSGCARWFVEAHQFRIDTAGGIGRPTPEGAHRDGVDVVVIVFVGRAGIKGGETRVFDAHGPHGVRFTLLEPWSALLLDDARVVHETTPIQPLEAAGEGVADVDAGRGGGAGKGHRDTLVLTFRRGAFQGPQEP